MFHHDPFLFFIDLVVYVVIIWSVLCLFPAFIFLHFFNPVEREMKKRGAFLQSIFRTRCHKIGLNLEIWPPEASKVVYRIFLERVREIWIFRLSILGPLALLFPPVRRWIFSVPRQRRERVLKHPF